MQKAINHIALACRHAGIREIIICPGSRNAPLTLAFVRSGWFNCHPVIDERSAGFIAMGMALKKQEPVAVICTSGSAVTNLYPAIVEAFYQRIPLVAITADRPPELIDQWDGQTIHQKNIFGAHVKASVETPDTYSDNRAFYQVTCESVQLSLKGIKGPVHINVPLREPLYPESDYVFDHEDIDAVPEETAKVPGVDGIPIPAGKKILVLLGMSTKKEFIPDSKMVIIKDMMSNVVVGNAADEKVLMIQDVELQDALRPDILITAGMAMLSKPLKNYLRRHKPAVHYHFSTEGDIADPFSTSPILVKRDLAEWLQQTILSTDEAYYNLWQEASTKVRHEHNQLIQDASWQEFSVIQEALNCLPGNSVLHLGNSMSVRYAAYCGKPGTVAEVYCNRGTSGIDGSVSTALGFSSKDARWNTLLLGDIAFLYDSNAFWNRLNKAHFRVIVINNAGGGIFRLIDGPSTQPELEEYFETIHSRNAEDLCKNLDITYYKAKSKDELNVVLQDFWNEKTGKAAVLEVFTDRNINQSFFKNYKSKINGIKVSLGNY